MIDPEPSDEATDSGGEGADPARFDEALRELEELVETLEQGDLSLEDSLAKFERGIGLARECRDALAAAEQRVQTLVEQDGDDEDTLADFEPEPDEG